MNAQYYQSRTQGLTFSETWEWKIWQMTSDNDSGWIHIYHPEIKHPFKRMMREQRILREGDNRPIKYQIWTNK